MERTKWWTTYVLLLVLSCEDVAVNSNMKYIELDVIHSLLCLKEMLKTLKVYACIGICILKIFIVFLTNVFKYSKTSVFFQVTMVFANPDVKKYRWYHELFLFHIWKKLMDEYIWFIYIFLLVPTSPILLLNLKMHSWVYYYFIFYYYL